MSPWHQGVALGLAVGLLCGVLLLAQFGLAGVEAAGLLAVILVVCLVTGGERGERGANE